MDIAFDVQGIQDTVALLRKVEPDSLKALRKEILNEPGLTAAVSAIKSQVPQVSPLQGRRESKGRGGMLHNGRTSYVVPSVKARSPLNTNLRGRNQKTIVSIDTITPYNAIGFEIIDLVGSGKNANTKKAIAMRRKLGGTPSRYVYKNFEQRVPGIQQGLTNILRRYAGRVNVKLRSRL